MTDSPLHPTPIDEHDAEQGLAHLTPDDIARMMPVPEPPPVEDPAPESPSEESVGSVTDDAPAAPPPVKARSKSKSKSPIPTPQTPDAPGQSYMFTESEPESFSPQDASPAGPLEPPTTGGGKRRTRDPFGAFRAEILSSIIAPRILACLDRDTIESKAELHRRFRDATSSTVSMSEFAQWLDECGIQLQSTLRVSLPPHLQRFIADARPAPLSPRVANPSAAAMPLADFDAAPDPIGGGAFTPHPDDSDALDTPHPADPDSDLPDPPRHVADDNSLPPPDQVPPAARAALMRAMQSGQMPFPGASRCVSMRTGE